MVESQARSGPGPPKRLVSGDQLGLGLQLGAPGAGEAEGGNKVTTGSSAFISPGYSQLQVSNLISAASCFLRCMAVPRHPLTCHQPREKGRVGGRMGVGLRLSGSLAHARAGAPGPPAQRTWRLTAGEQGSACLRNRGAGGDADAHSPTRGLAEAPLPHPSRAPWLPACFPRSDDLVPISRLRH